MSSKTLTTEDYWSTRRGIDPVIVIKTYIYL